MSDAILERRGDAIFINSESSEFYQPCCPDPHVQKIAEAANERRFLPLDLIFAHPLGPDMHDFCSASRASRRTTSPGSAAATCRADRSSELTITSGTNG